MTPDISIIIPAYNVAPFISQAITSALAQRDVAVEVISVDDGSTDETSSILSRFSGDGRVRIVSQANAGPSAARNVALEMARGRYVGFLDGDDLWAPNKAALHVRLLDSRPDLDLTYSWWEVIDEHGRATGRMNTEPSDSLRHGLSFESLLIENFTGTASTVVCRRTALKDVQGFDPSLTSNVDLDLWLRVALLRDSNIGLIPQVLTRYRLRGSQITSDWRRMQRNWEKVLNKARALAPERLKQVERLARARATRYYAYIAYTQNQFADARALLLRAWLLSPKTMLIDRRCRLTTFAVLATFLPDQWHSAMAASARRRQKRQTREVGNDLEASR